MISAKALVFSSCLSASLALAPAIAHAEGKIAVVDVQRAVNQTEEGLRAQAMLKKLFDNRQQELNRKQQDLAKQKEEIDKQAKSLAKDVLAKRVEDWQKQAMELQQVFVEYNKELEKKQREMTEPVYEKIIAIIKRVASTEGFDVVVDKSAVPFVRGDLDVTDKCIVMYNNGGAAAPAAAPKK